MSKVSIIIPLYNKAPYISKALDSICAQTFADWDCTIVNDGSTDCSLQIVEEYIAEYKDSRIKIISQNNSGVSTARNRGIIESSGEYVAFLDADDWWAPTYLEEMMQLIKDYPDAGIYGCDYYRVKRGKLLKYPKNAEGYINYYKVYVKSRVMPLHLDGVLIPKVVVDSCIKVEEFFPVNISLGEDFLVFMKIVTKYKVAFLNKQLVYFNQDSDSNWRATSKLHSTERHMLWNLQEYDELEKTNADYKEMVDFLRVFGLESYYRSKKYYHLTVAELKKVDWKRGLSSDDEHLKKVYIKAYNWSHTAPWILRIKHAIVHLLSNVKTIVCRYAK